MLVCKWGDLRKPEWVHPVPSPERGVVARNYILFPGPFEVAQPCLVTWPLSEATFADGLWSRWRLWEARVCKSSLWSSADRQEVNRILCVPQWALCLNSQLVPQELSGLCIYFQSFLPCVPYFAQPRRLRSGCWWQRYCGLRATTEDHTARERRRGP